MRACDPGPGTIFEGVIPIAGGGFFPIHPAFPLSAKTILLSGHADHAGAGDGSKSYGLG